MRRFFLLIITCLILTSAVSDSERVEVKSGESVTLRVERPGNMRLVTLKNCEKRTEDLIIRYCSPEEEKSGCTAKESDRFSINFDAESLSVSFVDARVSDEGCYVVSYTDVANNVKKKLFKVTVHGSLGNPEDFPIKGLTISLEYLIAIAVGITFVILAIIGVINRIINCQKRKQSNAGAGAGDPESIPLNSTSSGASKATDESQETGDEKECSLDNNSQQEEGAKDLSHGDRKRMTDKTGRTRHCVDSQNNHRG